VVQAAGGLHATLGSFATPAAVSRGFLAISHAELGNFAEGIVWLEEAQRIAGVGAAPWDVMTGWIAETWLCARRGDLRRGIPAGERALSLCESAGLAYLYAPAASLLGYLYALGDRLAEAVPLLEQAVERGAAIGQVVGESRFLARLGEGYLLTGQCEQAARTAERALATARERQERGNAAMALQLLGEIAAHGEPPDVEQAEAYYGQALVLATELGMRPVMAHCHLGLGSLYGQVERCEQAQAELGTAAELYRAMAMPFWLEKAETALTQLVP